MIKRIALLAVILLAISIPLRADSWRFDKAHSHVGFSVRHMVISNVVGEFNDFDGKVEFDGQNVEAGSVEVTVQMASINTANTNRDDHLKSPDFFDIEKNSTMTFKSKKITKPGADGAFTIVGDLTMKGVTKEVTLTGAFNGMVTDQRGNTRAGFSATTTINRQDFGVAWDNKLQDGSLVVSNEVKINLEIEMVKVKPPEKG